MYILDYLRDPHFEKSEGGYIVVEYRLLCSGELYNNRVVTFDWRKSDATRFLLRTPFDLRVTSQPFDDYPQELVLKFKVRTVTKKRGNTSMAFLPDDDIARDIAALLSLICRRLITVAVKTRVINPSDHPDQPEDFLDWPVPIVNSIRPTNWVRKSSTVVYGANGIEKIIDYNPPPKPIDPGHLKNILLNLPNIHQAQYVIMAARRYALALELIERRPEFSYQSLISGVEAIANSVEKSYLPDEKIMIEVKKPVFKLALEYGLEEDQAKNLAISACSGINWSRQKFSKFLVDYVTDELWTKDDVFINLDYFTPKKDQFKSALNRIYGIRSGDLHTGEHYPISATIGASPSLPVEIMLELGSDKKSVPPVTWFERVVHNALCGFIERSISEAG